MTREQKILKKVAKAFLTPSEERRQSQLYITDPGLCACCEFAGGSWEDWYILRIFKPEKSSPYWIPLRNPKSDLIRGLFALLLATMPEKDFKELYEEA